MQIKICWEGTGGLQPIVNGLRMGMANPGVEAFSIWILSTKLNT